MHYRAADISGSVFSLLSTLLTVRASIWAWPMGIIAVSIDFYLYFTAGLYADMTKEAIYFVSMFYGWYEWLRGGQNHTPLPITRMTADLFKKLFAVVVVAIALAAWILIRFTNSQVPLWDASTTVISLTAQWLTCRKILESWILWFGVDALYFGLYFYKDLPWHGFLYLFYLGCAVVGYWQWQKMMRQERADSLVLSQAV